MSLPLVGRQDELRRLADQVALGTGATVVWGMAGVGKTALVRAVITGDEGWRWLDARTMSADQLVAASDGPAVWDGVSLAVAHAALPQVGPVPIIATCRGRVDLSAVRCLELGPLAEIEAAQALSAALGHHGHQAPAAALQAMNLAFEGLPLAIERAARWFDIAGVSGLAQADPAAWQGPMDADAHLDSVRSALQDAWADLDEPGRALLAGLSTLSGPITSELAELLGGADSLEDLRRLRDHSWLQASGPGNLYMLGIVRAFVQGEAPAHVIETAADTLALEWLSRAQAAWVGLDERGATPADLQAYLRDISQAADRALAATDGALATTDPAGALCLLSVLVPGQGGTHRLEAALGRSAHPQDLRRAQARILKAGGEFTSAEAHLERALSGCVDGRMCGILHRELGVLAHRQRHVATATTSYERALSLHHAAGDARSTAVTQGNLAALAHDQGELTVAGQRYRRALDALRGLGDVRLEGITLSNLGALELERDNLTEAQDALTRGVAHLAESGDQRLFAIALGNLGWLAFMMGRPAEAERRLLEALASLPTKSDVRTKAIALLRLGAVRASQGQVSEALDAFTSADRALAGTEDRLTRRLVDLFRGFVDVATGARIEAVSRLDAARRPLDDGPALVAVSDDARTAVRSLGAALLRDPGRALCVGQGAEWIVVPGGERESILRFTAGRRILQALVEQRLAQPGVGLSLDGLFTAGWPDEQIRVDSARNRVHVALNQLRGVGLKPFIMRADSGYLLDPDLPVLAV